MNWKFLETRYNYFDAGGVLIREIPETRMEPQSALASPQTLNIAAWGEEILLENILIGDVWLLIGQSNMEWPMTFRLKVD